MAANAGDGRGLDERRHGCTHWPMRWTQALLGAVAMAWAAGACATLPTGVGERQTFRGVPGFDMRAYPGDTAMQRWRAASPYRWVGYYLPAPCHTDTTWVRRRAALTTMGWGMAVIFVGEQDWAATVAVAGPGVSGGAGGNPATGGAAAPAGAPGSAAATASAPAAGPRCTRSNLTAEHGAADAAAADSLMAAEGFARGARVFLDVEPLDSVSAALTAYVRAWIGGLLDRGHYLPAVYASFRNADSLRAIEAGEYARTRSTALPAFWVAGGSGFDVHAAPRESPVPFATIWQGASDVTEHWGGVVLSIDVDVADSSAPSTPAP